MDAVSLGRQRELLLEKIEIFDNTNRILRERLREWRDYEVSSFCCFSVRGKPWHNHFNPDAKFRKMVQNFVRCRVKTAVQTGTN